MICHTCIVLVLWVWAGLWCCVVPETCEGSIPLLKTLLHLMEIIPNFTYMLYSATAEDNVYHKNHQIHLGKTLYFTKHSRFTSGWHNFVEHCPKDKIQDQSALRPQNSGHFSCINYISRFNNVIQKYWLISIINATVSSNITFFNFLFSENS